MIEDDVEDELLGIEDAACDWADDVFDDDCGKNDEVVEVVVLCSGVCVNCVVYC